MKFILIGSQYYPYSDNDFDRFFQDILINNSEYTLKNNSEDIKVYFANNVENFFDDIPYDDDTDFSDVITGFNEYIDWLLTLS